MSELLEDSFGPVAGSIGHEPILFGCAVMPKQVFPRIIFSALQAGLIQSANLRLTSDSHAGHTITGTIIDRLDGQEYTVTVSPKVKP